MPCEPKPLSCDPSHLNAIKQKLAESNWVSAPVFEINGLK